MNLAALPKLNQKRKKRVGRGYGSGRGGHASTRGTKGQRSRDKIGLFFQGTKFKKSLLKRLPLMRGKGKLKSGKPPIVVNLKYLNLFQKGEEVSLASLQAKGILPKDLPEGMEVKVLGEGELKVPLVIALPTSRGAREKIEKVGGKVTAGKLKEGNKNEVVTKKVDREKKESLGKTKGKK